jgi:murein DD-endopeptidase MepM/ murein hydrolase activator NlpD
MKYIAFITLAISLSNFSCGSALRNLFSKQTPHEKYAEVLDDNGLNKTPEGRAWLAASEKALVHPQRISLPYRQHGYFHPDKPRALGLEFKARHGERISFTITKKGTAPFAIYADLFKQAESTSAPLLSADTALLEFSFDAAETATYLLRLQPELAHSGEYTLSVSISPSLGFPVSGSKAKTGSFWGADRDAGKRRHEGIDIFAPKLTPAVAAADGYISGVREGGIGGKTVWLNVADKNIYLYYAHLHKQLVQEGQQVKKGDVLGLVGNTGNAQYTPPHLHFGVYTFNGAIDPWPFVNRAVKKAPAVPAKNLTLPLQLVKTQKTADGSPAAPNTLLIPLAVSSKGYIAELPDGALIQVPFASVRAVKSGIKPSQSLATTPAGASKRS